MNSWIYILIALAISAQINASIPEPRIFIYKQLADVSITLNVYIPKRTGYVSVPIIFMVHGGIHVTGNKTLEIQSPRVFREFMNRGWCVITMNYLLGPQALVFDMLDDLVDAYAFLHEHLAHKFPIDINNIHLFGQSSAGTLVLLCGRLFEPRPKSVVAMYPVTDYVSNYIYVEPLKSDSLFLNLHRILSKQLVQESPVLGSLTNNPRIFTNPEALICADMASAMRM
ncbi:unnamed protein product [Adineta steineri]|uniref:BD-FAE-like domain-containing protein n=1 Tax=Adineta steineri TaxID=433720 RepID=A0A814EIP4_9BILA|nr:unnamed protein product [Adineta steineri]